MLKNETPLFSSATPRWPWIGGNHDISQYCIVTETLNENQRLFTASMCGLLFFIYQTLPSSFCWNWHRQRQQSLGQACLLHHNLINAPFVYLNVYCYIYEYMYYISLAYFFSVWRQSIFNFMYGLIQTLANCTFSRGR